MKIGWFIFK